MAMKRSRKPKRHECGVGFGGHSLGKAEIASQRQRVLRACKHILMRFCRPTTAAAVAGMARKRGCPAPPPRIVFQIGSGTREMRAEGPNIEP